MLASSLKCGRQTGVCGLKKVRAVIIGAIVQYILPKFERLIVCVRV